MDGEVRLLAACLLMLGCLCLSMLMRSSVCGMVMIGYEQQDEREGSGISSVTSNGSKKLRKKPFQGEQDKVEQGNQISK